jgi:hypothetical protein
MKISLENKYIVPLVPFLEEMKLKGEQSRARSKFVKLVYAAFAELHESEVDLVKEFAVTGEDGEPVCSEDGSFTLRNGAAKDYAQQRAKLFSEVAEIEGGTYTSHLKAMHQILLDYGGELSGEDAELYDALCEAFEEANTDDDE